MHTRTRTNLSLSAPPVFMSVCIIGAGGGGVNRVERIIFPAGRTGNVKKAFFRISCLASPRAIWYHSLEGRPHSGGRLRNRTAVCGCGAVKGPVVPWNGEQGRIAALNFVSLRFCAFFVAAVFVYYVLPRAAAMAACVQLLFLYVLESGLYCAHPVFRVQHLFVRACAGGIGCAGRREPGQAQGGHGRFAGGKSGNSVFLQIL